MNLLGSIVLGVVVLTSLAWSSRSDATTVPGKGQVRALSDGTPPPPPT
jgi:hypothetical protein